MNSDRYLFRRNLIEFLYQTRPEPTRRLKDTPQLFKGQENPFHMEDSVWTHTMMVLQASLDDPDSQIPDHLCALVHDFGKPFTASVKTRQDGKKHISFHGHGARGTQEAVDFILELRTRKIKNSSIRSYCRSVKAFLHWTYENNFSPDYLKGVKLPKDDAVAEMPLFVEDVVKIDALFDRGTEQGLRNYCIFHLLLDCGLRRQEVCHLQLHHLDPERNILHIVNSKENKSRFVLIPDFLISALQEYDQRIGITSGYMLRQLRDSECPLTSNTVKMIFQDLKISTGIDRLHAHLLRHTFAISYLIGGGNLEFLRVFLGHYDYAATKTYVAMAAQMKLLGASVYQLDPIFFQRGY